MNYRPYGELGLKWSYPHQCRGGRLQCLPCRCGWRPRRDYSTQGAVHRPTATLPVGGELTRNPVHRTSRPHWEVQRWHGAGMRGVPNVMQCKRPSRPKCYRKKGELQDCTAWAVVSDAQLQCECLPGPPGQPLIKCGIGVMRHPEQKPDKGHGYSRSAKWYGPRHGVGSWGRGGLPHNIARSTDNQTRC